MTYKPAICKDCPTFEKGCEGSNQEDCARRDIPTLRELFLGYLTVDSETHDARRKDFNQAIFDVKEGWAVFNRTDLSMVMEKFDKALNLFKTLSSS